jgi:hypothetical protein
MSIASIANRLVAVANDLMEEAGLEGRYNMIQGNDYPVETGDEPELPLTPVGDFAIGQRVNIINCKADGTVEALVGTVDYYGTDDEGVAFCHAVTDDGRKFKGPTINGQTRKGTRFDI